MATIDVPALSLVVLVGASGSGKSTFARKHFLGTEVISSDFCRGLVSDDENDQAATKDAFEVLHFIAGKRLAAGRLTVIDATNVQPEARKELVALAREHDVLPVAIVLDPPEQVCVERNEQRPDRQFGKQVVIRQRSQLRRGLKSLKREGFRAIHVLSLGRGDRGRRHRADPAVQRPRLTRPARSTSSATSTVAGPSWSSCSPHSTTPSPVMVTAARSTPRTPPGARSSSATWSTAARTHPAYCAW